jgi:hypothetical protein
MKDYPMTWKTMGQTAVLASALVLMVVYIVGRSTQIEVQYFDGVKAPVGGPISPHDIQRR